MLIRPPSSPAMAKRKPSPSAPMRFAAGTRQSSKLTIAVGCDFQPIFFSFAPNDRPGVPSSTTMADTPFGPGPPVRTMTT